MSSHEEATPFEPEGEPVTVEVIDPILGSDPWMRFDLWTTRLWESVENAKRLSESGDPSEMSAAVQASFGAAQFAHEIAKMVNPLSMGASEVKFVQAGPSDAAVRAMMEMLADDGDE